MLELLVYVFFLAVVMPALLLGMGKWVAVYTSRRPKFIGLPTRPDKPVTERSSNDDHAPPPRIVSHASSTTQSPPLAAGSLRS